MLRYPMHGFAKRVEDTVARAMAILQAKEIDIQNRIRLPATRTSIKRWQDGRSLLL